MIHWHELLHVVSDEEVTIVLTNLYLEMSVQQMAEHFGVSRSAVRSALRAYKIPLRRRGGKHTYYEKGGKP